MVESMFLFIRLYCITNCDLNNKNNMNNLNHRLQIIYPDVNFVGKIISYDTQNVFSLINIRGMYIFIIYVHVDVLVRTI